MSTGPLLEDHDYTSMNSDVYLDIIAALRLTSSRVMMKNNF